MKIKPKLQLIILSIVFTITALCIWHSDSPYPNPLNWDMYEHQTLINELREGHFALLTSQVSDTFTVNGYSLLFHLILAGLQLITGLSPLPFWFLAEKVFFFGTVLASFWLGWTVTKDRWAAFFSGMLGVFVFESHMAYTSLFLMPQTLCALIFVFALIRLFRTSKIFDFWQVLLLAVIFLLHYIVGTVAVLGILGIFFLLRSDPERSRGGRTSTRIFSIVPFVVFLVICATLMLKPDLSFDPFQTSESIHFNLNLAQKIEIMRQWYGFSFPVLFGLGILGVVKRGKRVEKAVLIIGLFLLGLVLTPFPYVVKFYVLARYLWHVVFAIGLSRVLGFLHSKCLKTIAVAFFCAIFILIFINNQQSFKSILKYNGLTTHTTSYDMLAAEFLKKNYETQSGILLVSEPATQGILEALSGVNTQGGVYMNGLTRKIVDSIYPTQDTFFIRRALYQVEDGLAREHGLARKEKKVLLVLSGRFFAWQEKTEAEKMDTSFNIWQPQDLTFQDKNYINWLKTQEGFNLVFENEGMAIFEVEP